MSPSTPHRSACRTRLTAMLADAFGYAARRLVTMLCIALTAMPHGARAWSEFANDIQFPQAARTAQEALDKLVDRRDAIAKFGACGDEMDFKQRVLNTTDNPGTTLSMVIAKMLWLLLDHPIVQPQFPTTPGGPPSDPGEIIVKHHDDIENVIPDITRIQLTTVPAEQEQPCRAPAKVPNTQMADINRELTRLYGRVCNDTIVGGEFIVTPECLRKQINEALSRVNVKDQLGSSDVPCYTWTGGTTKGEWDVTVRDLTRIFYLNLRFPERQMLTPATVKHIQEDLLTADGAPGQKSYSPFYECGNQEKSTGSAQERLDRRGWLSETLDDILSTAKDIWDWLKDHIPLPDWLKKFLAIVLLTLAPGLAPWLEALLTLGTIDFLDVRIPETENHLLNIETSRYLNNEIIIADLRKSGDDPGPFVDDQERVVSNLHSKFQQLVQTDFAEYNALPYSRYSLLAILNIAQFANDKQLREGARMVLDYVTAKAAVGSDGGRRLVSYRRHMEGLNTRGHIPMFNTVWNSDHVIPYMIFYTGQTQHMLDNKLDLSMFEHMIYHASASIGDNTPGETPPMPDRLVLEAAIEKGKPNEQRIHHTGIEIYSSGDGWLISAGGVQTGPVNFIVAPVPPFYKNDDRGAAWPTTLFLSASGLDTRPIDDFVRIEGIKIVHMQESEEDGRDRATGEGGVKTVTTISHEFLDDVEQGVWVGTGTDDQGKPKSFRVNDMSVVTYDGNLCVGQGFACGFNVEIPSKLGGSAIITGCGETRPGGWTFIDTDKCYPNDKARGTRAFVGVRRQACPSMLTQMGCRNFGFLEVVGVNDPALASVAEGSRFSTFIDRMMSRNANLGNVTTQFAGGGLPPQGVAQGTYTGVKEQRPGVPHTVKFEGFFAGNDTVSRVTAVDGQERKSESSWNLAEGTFINANSKGRVEIGWKTRNDGKPPSTLIMDYANHDFPYRIPPPQ